MSMDAIFHFDEQEFVSKPVVLRAFFEDAIRTRDSLETFFGAKMGEKDAWQKRFIPWLQCMALAVDESALHDIRKLVNDVAAAYSNPTKQYCFEKDGGLSNIQLNKRSRLRSINILQELNVKRKNPHYKSISLRSMLYDKYDPYVFVRRAHHSDLDVGEENRPVESDVQRTTEALDDKKMSEVNPIDPSDDGMFVGQYSYRHSPLVESSIQSSASSSDAEPGPLTGVHSCSNVGESGSDMAQDDIVVEIAIFLGYPRPLEKHEIRLGRLMKVLDRFLILGSNTLKDLKNAIDCTSDYQVLENVVDRSITEEDLCKNRYPSSYFFFHDTFYIDMEPKGSKDITVEIREWANKRNIADMKVADMNTTRIIDLTCRFGAPYLYNHVGACEHLVVVTRAALRDTSHPVGPYPVPIYERNFRRIACAGCKQETAEWVLWEHECMPCYTQFLCDACYKEFNYDKSGKRIFKYKAAPWYDRRSRKTGPLVLQKMKIVKDDPPDDTVLIP